MRDLVEVLKIHWVLEVDQKSEDKKERLGTLDMKD